MAAKNLIVMACCKSKKEDAERWSRWEIHHSALGRLSPKRASNLRECRCELANRYEYKEGRDLGSETRSAVPLMPAYQRYNGNLYGRIESSLWQRLRGKEDVAEVVIVSALYGLLTPWEAIRKYELAMDDSFAEWHRLSRWWRERELGQMLAEFAVHCGAETVHDFLPIEYRKATRLGELVDGQFSYKPYRYSSGSGSDYHRGDDVRELLHGVLGHAE